MRLLSVLLVLFSVSSPAFAADTTVTAVVKEKPGLTAWQSLSKPARRELLEAWKALPETTRPSFPVFRDSQLEKRLKPATPAKTAEKTK